jgi:hypothetical protein
MSTRIPAENQLRRFVNRTREFGRFCQMLDGEAVAAEAAGLDGAQINSEPALIRIMCLCGEGGMGKSILLGRMMKECQKRGLSWVHIEWEDSRIYSYLNLMCTIRDKTNPEAFAVFSERVNHYAQRSNSVSLDVRAGDIHDVEILEHASIEQSNVEVRVGHTINVINPEFHQTVSDTEIMLGTTGPFLECLTSVTAQGPVLIFLDAMEKAQEITVKWIVERLLVGVRDGDLTNLFVVLSGRKSLDLPPSFSDCAEMHELQPFAVETINEYLSASGIPPQGDLMATFIFQHCRGNPLEIANSVNSCIRTMRERENH